MIENKDSLEFLKSKSNFENDIIYADVPYALGSEVFIQENGKPEYRKAVDFMNKWEMPNGAYWEQWFKEAFRTLKYGGYCLIFGIDRQLMLFKYYAALAGFKEQQSLYWYFISNFPKSADLSKNIDKNFGLEREVVAAIKTHDIRGGALMEAQQNDIKKDINSIEYKITISNSELAKKYDGYKYSVAPLKQTNETIMVFQKPYKSGSCLHDTLAYENGDSECCCSALNIDDNRVGEKNINTIGRKTVNIYKLGINNPNFSNNHNGRYPAQTFIECNCEKVISTPAEVSKPDEVSGGIWTKSTGKPAGNTYKGDIEIHTNNNCACNVLNRQSGNLKGGGAISKHQQNNESELNFTNGNHAGFEGFNDFGGCSKILHKCSFEKEDFDIYMYCPKVSQKERNIGCENIQEKEREERGNNQGTRVCVDCGLTDNGINNHEECSGNFEYKLCQSQRNNHPTLKPISLNYRILRLFKTPNKQRICYPFAGAGSEIIGGLKAGFDDYTACEINSDYIDIANSRIEFFKNNLNIITETGIDESLKNEISDKIADVNDFF